MLRQTGGIRDGARVLLMIGRWPFRTLWDVEHRDYIAGRQFRDIQLRGPFSIWEHTHAFQPINDQESTLEDRITYRLPLDWFTGWFADRLVRRKLQRVFDYRHRITAGDLAAQARTSQGAPMKILLSGSSGMVGTALMPVLTQAQYQICRLTRSRAEGDDVLWNPAEGSIDRGKLEGFHGVVHLAGENIAGAQLDARGESAHPR